MLEGLCGNKNIERILLFLFVNGKCYGTQLHNQLKTPLTPIQKALLRLEKGEVILSFFEGKTKFYQFNPNFPLLEELEQLLKKTYTFLPAHEKKDYYFAKEDAFINKISHEKKLDVLLACWDKLAAVKKLSFKAKSQSKEAQGWNGKGIGEVFIKKETNIQLLFSEKGSWRNVHGNEFAFSNIFRWSLDKTRGVISLEHLRRGIENPVFLFHLAPSSNKTLSSVDSHLCEGDTYFGQIQLDKHSIRLNWRVIGPKKNEEIDYYYS